MKKILVTFFTGILLPWTIASSYSQNLTSPVKPGFSQDAFISLVKEINGVKDSGSARLNELNTRAVRNFIKDYENVSNAKWFKLKEGSVVYFTSDSIDTRAIFDIRGNYIAIVRQYYEEKLPKEIRHLVKSKYYDFSIYLINEVNSNGSITYVVTLEGKTSWKTITVINGELEETNEYSK